MHSETETNLEQKRQQESFKNKKRNQKASQSVDEYLSFLCSSSLWSPSISLSQRLSLPTSFESLPILY